VLVLTAAGVRSGSLTKASAASADGNCRSDVEARKTYLKYLARSDNVKTLDGKPLDITLIAAPYAAARKMAAKAAAN